MSDRLLDFIGDHVIGPFIVFVLMPGCVIILGVLIYGLVVGDPAPVCQAGYRAAKVESHEVVSVLVGKVPVPTPMVVTRWLCVKETP